MKRKPGNIFANREGYEKSEHITMKRKGTNLQ